jgi:GH15 family glucan-1,4-alpha-glucosidase
MTRPLSLGNGTILVCTDERAEVRDFYFPYVGLENHIGGHFSHRIGIYVDGQLNWFTHSNWKINSIFQESSLSGETIAHNEALGVKLKFVDLVYNE